MISLSFGSCCCLARLAHIYAIRLLSGICRLIISSSLHLRRSRNWLDHNRLTAAECKCPKQSSRASANLAQLGGAPIANGNHEPASDSPISRACCVACAGTGDLSAFNYVHVHFKPNIASFRNAQITQQPRLATPHAVRAINESCPRRRAGQGRAGQAGAALNKP